MSLTCVVKPCEASYIKPSVAAVENALAVFIAIILVFGLSNALC